VCNATGANTSGAVFEFQALAPTPDSDRACQNSTVCTATQFEAVAGTASSDRACAPLTVCGAGSDEITPPTRVSDRICACNAVGFYQIVHDNALHDTECDPYTVCEAGFAIEAVAPTPTSDRVCSCPPNAASVLLGNGRTGFTQTCQCLQGYFTVSDTSGGGLAAECHRTTACTLHARETVAPTPSSDRACECSEGWYFVSGMCKEGRFDEEEPDDGLPAVGELDDSGFPVAFVIIVIIIILLVMLGLCLMRVYKNRQLQKKDEDEPVLSSIHAHTPSGMIEIRSAPPANQPAAPTGGKPQWVATGRNATGQPRSAGAAGLDPDAKALEDFRKAKEAVRGHSNGATNGHSNGASNGAGNGHSNGASNGRRNGAGNGHSNGASNGHRNGASNGAGNGHDLVHNGSGANGAGPTMPQRDYATLSSPHPAYTSGPPPPTPLQRQYSPMGEQIASDMQGEMRAGSSGHGYPLGRAKEKYGDQFADLSPAVRSAAPHAKYLGLTVFYDRHHVHTHCFWCRMQRVLSLSLSLSLSPCLCISLCISLPLPPTLPPPPSISLRG
jgi:hypothetical protein